MKNTNLERTLVRHRRIRKPKKTERTPATVEISCGADNSGEEVRKN